MKKRTILTVGDVILEEELYKSDVFGGKIYATNTKTNEVYTEKWMKMHGGKNNRWAVMANCVAAVAPKPEENEDVKDGIESNECDSTNSIEGTD